MKVIPYQRISVRLERKESKHLLLSLLERKRERVVYHPFLSSMWPSTVCAYKQERATPRVQTVIHHSLVLCFPIADLSLFLEGHEAVISCGNQQSPLLKPEGEVCLLIFCFSEYHLFPAHSHYQCFLGLLHKDLFSKSQSSKSVWNNDLHLNSTPAFIY